MNQTAQEQAAYGICVFDLMERVGFKCKVKPVKSCKVWKLKQAETKNHLQREGSGESCSDEERAWGCRKGIEGFEGLFS